MNQEYKGRVDRWLKSGGDPKYVNVKKKAEARHQAYTQAQSNAIKMKAKGTKYMKIHPIHYGEKKEE